MIPRAVRMVVLARMAIGLSYFTGVPVGLLAAVAPDLSGNRVSNRVHAFYYPWYGNPETDNQWQGHWNHPVAVRSGPARSYPGGEDIGANFYPLQGCTSSNSSADLDRHMRDLRRAGVGVLSLSWWGIGSYTDRAVPKVLAAAARHRLRVNFHLEPNLGPGGRNPRMVRQAIRYIVDRYGQHEAFYRCRFQQGQIDCWDTTPAGDRVQGKNAGRPLFYIYDSYLTSAAQWATLLAPDGNQTIRDTPYDSVMVGLWVKNKDGLALHAAHFDGYYTYFASDGFTDGSTPENWPTLAKFAREHGMAFIPSVAPGYDDTRIRPWNSGNTRNRESGKYYDRMFQSAIRQAPPVISITSFNEWHEGTQIEPATPKTVTGFTYEDYRPLSPFYYLDRTRYWIDRYEAERIKK